MSDRTADRTAHRTIYERSLGVTAGRGLGQYRFCLGSVSSSVSLRVVLSVLSLWRYTPPAHAPRRVVRPRPVTPARQYRSTGALSDPRVIVRPAYLGETA